MYIGKTYLYRDGFAVATLSVVGLAEGISTFASPVVEMLFLPGALDFSLPYSQHRHPQRFQDSSVRHDSFIYILLQFTKAPRTGTCASVGTE